uniref:Pentacotripeptide-repeat region of PRORP domain-containing protein n=1 Tax=Alexandrium monilatum TaxID=311494 RepID=A0A7S4V8N9_9DINO
MRRARSLSVGPPPSAGSGVGPSDGAARAERRRPLPRAGRLALRVAASLAAVGAAGGLAASALAAEAMAMGRRRGWSPTAVRFISRGPQGRPKPPPSLEEQTVRGYERDLADCEERGDWARALELLGWMATDRVQRARRAWASAAGACARAGRWVEATRLLEDMDEARVPADHGAFSAAIEACEEQGAHEHATKLMLDMGRRGLPAQLDTYSKYLRVLVQNGRVEDARALYAEANTLGLFSVWVNRGRFLDLQEVPIEVAEVVLRFAVEERADTMVRQGKAGKGGFYVLTGQANKATAFKQQAVIRVMREEFGLKIRVDPARFGRVQVRGTELRRIGEERLRAQAVSSNVYMR